MKCYNTQNSGQWAETPDIWILNIMGETVLNFASQCIYAGSKVMNYTPVTGWYYNSSSDRTASWTVLRIYIISLWEINQSGHMPL